PTAPLRLVGNSQTRLGLKWLQMSFRATKNNRLKSQQKTRGKIIQGSLGEASQQALKEILCRRIVWRVKKTWVLKQFF
ncbi:MAG: hypothetical protein AAB558_02725, partial [Patescibacteria group bacterium]